MLGSNSVLRLECHCDICEVDLTGRFRYEAATRQGPWAIMCHNCWHDENGALGIGIGQKFDAHGRCVAGNKEGQLLRGLPEKVIDLEAYLGRGNILPEKRGEDRKPE